MTNDHSHICPRCQQPRCCQPEAIASCPCSSLQLSPALQAYLAAHYQDCLCNPCLIALSQQFPTNHTTTNDRTGKNSELRDPYF